MDAKSFGHPPVELPKASYSSEHQNQDCTVPPRWLSGRPIRARGGFAGRISQFLTDNHAHNCSSL